MSRMLNIRLFRITAMIYHLRSMIPMLIPRPQRRVIIPNPGEVVAVGTVVVRWVCVWVGWVVIDVLTVVGVLIGFSVVSPWS